MNKVYSVKVNNITKGDGVLKIFSHCYSEEQKKLRKGSEKHQSINIFFNDKYVLNFICTEDEVIANKQRGNVKHINDIGFKLFSDAYHLNIMKYCYGIPIDEERNQNSFAWINGGIRLAYDEVSFTVKDIEKGKGSISTAIEWALKNPIVSDSLPANYLPEDYEEVKIGSSRFISDVDETKIILRVKEIDEEQERVLVFWTIKNEFVVWNRRKDAPNDFYWGEYFPTDMYLEAVDCFTNKI